MAWVRSKHFDNSNKVNRINTVGTMPKGIAFDNVGFQASRYETALQRLPLIAQTFFQKD